MICIVCINMHGERTICPYKMKMYVHHGVATVNCAQRLLVHNRGQEVQMMHHLYDATWMV